MQIQNQVAANQLKTEGKPVELKQNDIVSAKVKDVKANGEATLQIRGREVQAKFEGKIPTNERVTVQVTGQKDGVLQVKNISEATTAANPSKQMDSAKVLQSLGMNGKEAPEVKQAVSQLLNKGVPLSKESVRELKAFFEKGNGTTAQKLETVKALADKRLEVTSNQLRAVHEALHGKKLGETLTNLAKSVDPNFKPGGQEQHTAVREILRQFERSGNISKAINQVNELVRSKQVSADVARNLMKAIGETQKLQQLGKEAVAKQWLTQALKEAAGSGNQNKALDQMVKEVLQMQKTSAPKEEQANTRIKQTFDQIQKEPNLQKAIDLVKNELKAANLNESSKQQVEKVITRAEDFQTKGRELKARQELVQALDILEKDIGKTATLNQEQPVPARQNAAQTQVMSQDVSKPQDPSSQTQSEPMKNVNPAAGQYVSNQEFQTSVQLETKDFIVRTVSQKLAEATAQFKDMKREVTKNLDHVQKLIQQYQNSAKPQAKQILESTIKQLDNAILKSDAMLFADMKTEKNLLQASGQLAQAQKLLNKGNHSEAGKIVQEVKASLEKMNFNPAEMQVKRYITKEMQMQETRTPSQALLNNMSELTSHSASRQDPSARQMFETIRQLGLNHESELGKSLIFKQGDASSQQQSSGQQQNQNLKALLMQMMRSDGEMGRQSEQALNNLTGQQLLSKSDSGSNLQSMMFNLPMMLENQVENLQVFVNSRNQGEQVDWENCNLYFLIETKKMGEVGIMVSTNDRNLSITIKNDKNEFKDKMTPLAEMTKDKLNEIGYNVSGISFAKMKNERAETTQPRESNEQRKPRPTFSEKGMDFKI